jgi:hypothetical protein
MSYTLAATCRGAGGSASTLNAAQTAYSLLLLTRIHVHINNHLSAAAVGRGAD